MKDNTNPIAVAETAIADFVRELPEISALFSGDGIAVFANTAEDASGSIEQAIASGVQQCIIVAFQNIAEATHTCDSTFGLCNFSVAITSPGLLAELAIRSTSDIASAIIRELDGVLFSSPFESATMFNSWNQGIDADGRFLADLNFTARVKIRGV